MKKLKDILSNWKEQREINNFIKEVEPGFNYFKNKYNPRNFVEIYRTNYDEYTIRELNSKHILCTYETDDKDILKDYIVENNYQQRLIKSNYLDISNNLDTNYDLKDNSINEIKDRVNDINKRLEKIQNSFSSNKKSKNKEMER